MFQKNTLLQKLKGDVSCINVAIIFTGVLVFLE